VYLLTGGRAPCRTELVGFQGSEQVFSTPLRPPAGMPDPFPAADDGSAAPPTPSIAAAGPDRVVTSPIWYAGSGRPGSGSVHQVTQLHDSTGHLLGTLPGRLTRLAANRLLPVPLGPGPRSALGAVVLAPRDKTSNLRADRWVTLSTRLAVTSDQPVPDRYVQDYRVVGPFIVAYPWGDDTVTLRSSDPGLTVRDRLQPSRLRGCRDASAGSPATPSTWRSGAVRPCRCDRSEARAG
jgi:hypothetical protein